MKEIINTVVHEINEVLKQVNEDEVILLATELQNARRIFISGKGRSGLVGKVFAMRLMQSKFQVYVVGETITPSIESDDLLIIVSGSGDTESLTHISKRAKEIGAKLALVTTNGDSKIGKISDFKICIPAATKKREAHTLKTIQPLGSQFDQSVHILLDVLIVYLLGIEDDEGKVNIQLNKQHANLE